MNRTRREEQVKRTSGLTVLLVALALAMSCGGGDGDSGGSGDAARFEACADGLTVADTETGLLWERKTGTPGAFVICTSAAVCPDAHVVNNRYTWSVSGSAAPDGTAYTLFLADLNTAPGFAGHTGWRLPIISELQSILLGSGVLVTTTSDPLAGDNPRIGSLSRVFA